MTSGKLPVGWLTMALVFAAAACLAAAPSAGAATLTFAPGGGGTFVFTADAGEADAVQVLPSGSNGRFTLSDSADTITLGSGTGCTGGGTNTVDCPDSMFLNMTLGDQSDVAVVNDSVDMFFVLNGDSGNDSLDGGGSIDQINGGSGNDPALSGGGGSDTIKPGDGPDGDIDGGPGEFDTIDYDDGRATGVTVNLEAGTSSDGETLSSIEGAYGSDQNDTLQGTAGENVLEGRAGADVLIGGGAQDVLDGNDNSFNSDGAPDTVSYSERSTPVVTSLATGTSQHQDTDAYRDISNLAGGGGNDVLTGDGLANVLTGNGGADMLFGGAGVDTLNGNDGNDVLTGGLDDDTIDGGLDDDTLLGGSGADDLLGGGNTDTVSYQDGRLTGIALDLGAGALPDSDTYTAIDSVVGTEQGDTMTGGPGADDLRGGGGGDTIAGAAGIDNLQAQDGDDKIEPGAGPDGDIDGGPGTDEISYDDGRAAGVTVNLEAGTSSDGETLSGIERAFGSEHNDTLRGTAGENVLEGRAGADVLFGGAGVDTLNGNEGNDELFGESEVDTLDGGLDDDTLLGGSGVDNLLGGGNHDMVSYQDGRVTGIAVDLGAGALPDGDSYTAIEGVIGSEQGDTMTGGPGADDLRGAGGGDTITGAAGVDNLQAQDGDDTVRAKDGETDTVGCGAGTDQVEADGADSQSECETQLGIQPPADPGGGAGSLASVAGLKITGAFRSAGKGASIAAPVGGRVTYRLSEAARVTFTVRRLVAGRRRGRRCVRASPRLRRARRCTRQVRVRGSFTHSGKAGANSFRFTGRLRGRRLRPGRYLLAAVPVDSDGRRGAQRTARFRIVRR